MNVSLHFWLLASLDHTAETTQAAGCKAMHCSSLSNFPATCTLLWLHVTSVASTVAVVSGPYDVSDTATPPPPLPVPASRTTKKSTRIMPPGPARCEMDQSCPSQIETTAMTQRPPDRQTSAQHGCTIVGRCDIVQGHSRAFHGAIRKQENCQSATTSTCNIKNIEPRVSGTTDRDVN